MCTGASMKLRCRKILFFINAGGYEGNWSKKQVPGGFQESCLSLSYLLGSEGFLASFRVGTVGVRRG